MTPRVKTEDEVRVEFLQHLRDMIRYWATIPNPSRVGGESEIEARIGGAIFSALVTLDGGSGAICGFKVIPNPHPDDEEYHRSTGENWYPDDVDIAGGLHELLYDKNPAGADIPRE
jgi:hypothetical protein